MEKVNFNQSTQTSVSGPYHLGNAGDGIVDPSTADNSVVYPVETSTDLSESNGY